MRLKFKIAISSLWSLILLIFFFESCTFQKNTSISRFYHATNTRYNVFYNGKVSYDEGFNKVFSVSKDDYSSVIPMFPISHDGVAKSATPDMDKAIEKCRKAIKLHSIKAKPKKDYKRANQPEYLLFYNQQEFNPALKDVWFLLAQSEFHKGDFLGAMGTFMYISRLYSSNKDIVTHCQVWVARCYSELGWLYEAEDVLAKINQDALNRSNSGLFAAVNADLLIKKHSYNDAIPFLELAVSREQNKKLKQRFTFVLAQLYKYAGNNKAAFQAYEKVIKSNPPYEMAFNARISSTQLNVSDIRKMRKSLKSMISNKNNKEYLDQLYGAMANTYFQQGDTLHGIDNLKLAAEKSTRKGLDHAVNLILLGDIYYGKRDYVHAQPFYENASKIITREQTDYLRVSRRAEMLSTLIIKDNSVKLQDSLILLSKMSETDRLEAINRTIDKVKNDEKLAAQKAALEELETRTGNEEVPMVPIGGNMTGQKSDWYFYNPMLVQNGLSDFKKKWGARKLEDNWRRINKVSSVFGAETAPSTMTSSNEVNEVGEDSVKINHEVNDNKSVAYYLKQIPFTSKQQAAANAEIASSLFDLGFIYKDNIEDYTMATRSFEDFAKRFETEKRMPEVLYQLYLIASKEAKPSIAEQNRARLISKYPNSKYAEMLSQPDYTERMICMYYEQDSLYAATYYAFLKSDFSTVSSNVEYVRKNYPVSDLMPKFLFLDALTVGKSAQTDKFVNLLETLVKQYPESDVSSMSKDMLALMKQGREVKSGTTSGSLMALRDKESQSAQAQKESKKLFSTDKQTKHRLLLLGNITDSNLNKLLFNVASFNFSRFMIKDFDLVVNKIDSLRSALCITNLESYDEANWYLNSMKSDSVLSTLINNLSIKCIVISENNFALLRSVFSIEEYESFVAKTLFNTPTDPHISVLQKKSVLSESQKKAQKQKDVSQQDSKLADNLLEKGENIVQKNQQDLRLKNEVLDPKTAVNAGDLKENKISLDNDGKIVQNDKSGTVVIKQVASSATSKEASAEGLMKVGETDLNAKNSREVAKKSSGNEVVNKQVVEIPKKPDVPLFKNLYAYRPEELHFVALYVMTGNVDFQSLKTEVDAYNSKNYPLMNLKVSLEKDGKQQFVIIGSMPDANTGKSYLMRFAKDKGQFSSLNNFSYRSMLGTQENLNVMLQKNALNEYFEFMLQYYMK